MATIPPAGIEAPPVPPPPHVPGPVPMTLRQVDLAMAGLTLSLFVASLSNLVVLTAMPRIVAELRGTQADYTWIITSSMITITVLTPIWGRMSDLFDQKRLLQWSVGGYVFFSIIAGFAPGTLVIILCRVGIGVCAAGIIVLMQAIAVEITTPRHRARWVGYRSAVMSVATVGAPTLGGFLAQHIGWRACFFVGVPMAILSIAMVQVTLRLPRVERTTARQVDWVGGILVAGSIITLMVWMSVVGPQRGFNSSIALAVLAAGTVLATAAAVVELRVPAPILPLALFRQRDVALCAIASFATGFAFFGSAVFLAMYLQIGRGFSAQTAGLMALPEAAATVVSAVIASRIIAGTGRYKPALLIGSAMIAVGFALLSRVGTATPLLLVGACVALIGGGLGIVSENLVLIVQTRVPRTRAGAAGALISFFRMAGGVTAVAALGAVIAAHVVANAPDQAPGVAGRLPSLASLEPAQRAVLEALYSSGVARAYLICALVSSVMLLAVSLLANHTLAEDHPPE